MQEQNKIYSGIAGFMQTQSLFKKQIPKTTKLITTSTKSHSLSVTQRNCQILTANKYIQIDAPIQPKRDKSINNRKDDYSPIRDQTFIKNPQNNLKQSRIKTMKDYSEIYDEQIVPSKKKYFQSCRKQASQYAQKISGLLNYDLQLIDTKIEQVRLTIKQHSSNQKQKLRSHIYKLIDKCIQEWEAQHNNYLSKNEIYYIGDLLQLQNQIQNRLSKVNQIVMQLNSPNKWKIIASQLLSNRYEEQAVSLSQQVASTIKQTNNITKKMITQDNEHISFQIHKISLHSDLPNMIKKALLEEVGNNSLMHCFKSKINQKCFKSEHQ